MSKYTLEDFIKSRDRALMSGDVEQIRAHLARFGNKEAKKEDAKVLEISLHKSRVHWRDCPPDKLKESVWWLLDHGYSLMMDD